MHYPSCPLKSGGFYRYYAQEVARVAKEIKRLERRMIAESLATHPGLADNSRWREVRKFKPHEILRLLGGGGFYICPHPVHDRYHNGRGEAEKFVAWLLNDPDYKFPERR